MGRGPLYRPPWVVGGIHNPTIDPERHFNQQDRFLTVSFFEYVKFILYPMLGVRVQAYMAILPVCGVLMLTLLEHRREPMEIFMDRETYWKDADSYMWGVSTTTISHTSCVTAVLTSGAMRA